MGKNNYIRMCIYTPKMNMQSKFKFYFTQFQELTVRVNCGQSKNIDNRDVDIR